MAARLPQQFAALENAVVILCSAFTFRPAISPPAQLLQLIRRAQEKASVDNVRYLWIQRLNAAARANGMTYSRLAEGLKAAGLDLDRKILADLAVTDEAAFKSIVEQARAALEKKNKKAA